MRPQLPSNLKQYPRIAVEVAERDEDCRMSFGGVDGVFRGVRADNPSLIVLRDLPVNGEVKETMEAFGLGIDN